MLFIKTRNLHNKIFSTAIERITKGDSKYNTERVLEDDFGHVSVDIGGKFEVGYILAEGDIIVMPILSNDNNAGMYDFRDKFIIDSKLIEIVPDVKIEYYCDAKGLNSAETKNGITISALKIAESRCVIFEKVIEERIENAISEWKKNSSNFEQEVEGFEIPLI